MSYYNPYEMPEPTDEPTQEPTVNELHICPSPTLHDWEYSDQSEPHKGREYFSCNKCDMVLHTDPQHGGLLFDQDGVLFDAPEQSIAPF